MALPSVNVITQVERSGTVYFHAKWRRRMPDGTTRQVKRTLGPAWLQVDSAGGIVRRKGRPTEGFLDQRAATVMAQSVMETVESEHAAKVVAEARAPTAADLFERFLDHRERVKGLRPATIRDYRSVLQGEPVKAISPRPAAEVTPREIENVLDAVSTAGGTARTVNKYRAILAAAWEWGNKPSALGLPSNPAKGADRRREAARRTVDWYSVEEVELIARTLASSTWRETRKDGEPAREPSAADAEKRALSEAEDPHLIRLAAYAGLRLSEIVALTWADVDFGRRAIHVRSTVSDGKLVDAPKRGKHRSVPMSDRAAAALDALSRRDHFTEPADFVAVGPVGERITGGALSRRFGRARDFAGMRPLLFRHLRHTFGSQAVAGGVDLAQVKAAMGHSKIETTERYLHAKSSADVADAFSRAQQGSPTPHPPQAPQGDSQIEQEQHDLRNRPATH